MQITSETEPDHEKLLERLNQASLTQSFVPQVDIDWDASTTDDEYESLYTSWSLLEGSGLDHGLDFHGRVKFVKYQQMNLMLFTELVERHGLTALIKLYDNERSVAFKEYLSHFIKEESYHATMFMLAVEKIESTMPGCKPVPKRGMDLLLRFLFRFLNMLPGKKLRNKTTFSFLHFAEQVTLHAHQITRNKITRRESLIHQVWAYHALDESRHVTFDRMILTRDKPPRLLAWVPYLATPCSALASVMLNANEIWIARQLGVRVGLWQLPALMWRTQAPFKRWVFRLWTRSTNGLESSNKEQAHESCQPRL
jgi:hypothetical protein